MPRKPKQERQEIIFVVNGQPITVIMHPPAGAHKSWRAYWHGLPRPKTTGHRRYDEAVVVAENMLRNGGNRVQPTDLVMSDEEFDSIQRQHFGKKKDPAAQVRAQKVAHCLHGGRFCFPPNHRYQPNLPCQVQGLRAFSGSSPEETARTGGCPIPRKTTTLRLASGPTRSSSGHVALQAAFERANRNAGKKCVRTNMDERKLLTSNPWKNFTWIGGTPPKKRHLTDEELLSILDYLEGRWPNVTTGTLFAKTSLWMWARRAEVASLRWENLRIVGNEYHFDFIGKWGIRKWARIPTGLYHALLKVSH